MSMWSRVVIGCLLFPALLSASATEPANPSVSGTNAFFANQGLTARHLPSGEIRWRVLTDEYLFAPVLSEGLLLAGGSRGLVALALMDGEVRWRLDGGTRFSPIVRAGVAYSGARDGRLVALDLATGEILWSRRFPGWVYSPAVIDEVLVVGGSNQTLWGVREADGAKLWSLPLDQELVYRPIATAEGVVITTFAGTSALVDARGNLLWRRADGVATIAPVASATTLLLAGMDGSLRARSLKDGGLLWRADLSARVVEPPLLHEEGALLLTEAGEWVRVDLRSGVLGRQIIPLGQEAAPLWWSGGFHLAITDKKSKEWRLRRVPFNELNMERPGGTQ